ncbi:MAG TPA: adenylate/guanylate cyclase domain-containing protein [Flavipsychrobacter sp.]|nr:adenylate/guanylate cyclase domain-containing protein [Flavipsychrobacter sp.]
MKKILFLLLTVAPLWAFADKKVTDTLVINDNDLRQKINSSADFSIDLGFPINFLCRYKQADSAVFGSPAYDDGAWEKRAPFFGEEEVKKDTSVKGIGWFRLRLRFDSLPSEIPIALVFRGTGALQAYLDGKLLTTVGKFEENGQHRYLSLNTQPIFLSIADTGVHLLAFRYEYNTARENEDVWGISMKVKPASYVFHHERNTIIMAAWFLVGLGSVFLALFAVHFLMFLFYRKEVSNLYFALFTLSVATFLYCAYLAMISVNDITDNHVYRAVLGATCIIGSTSLSAFTAALFSRKKLFLKLILVFGAITLCVALLDLDGKYDVTDYVIFSLFILSLGYTIIKITVAVFKKVPGALLLGSGILFFLIFMATLIVTAAVTGSIELNNWIGFLFLLAIFSIPFSISAFLAWRFSSTSKSLSRQLVKVETLSQEKETILENQKAALEKEVAIRTQEVVEQKQKSDELLLNILPAEVAEELKLNGKSAAHRYDEVSVLFTDFVNFTRISEQLGVEDLLNELNIHFTAFDKIIEKYGLEKIKTIGDAYLAVCGLPQADEEHAQNTVRAALEILDFVKKRKKETPYGLDIRIGINSGAVIAGIIGVKKFAYDIWGDTVNTAARMEQKSEPGKINISENTFKLVKDEFACTHRGKLIAKNKGEMDMYFVESSS